MGGYGPSSSLAYFNFNSFQFNLGKPQNRKMIPSNGRLPKLIKKRNT